MTRIAIVYALYGDRDGAEAAAHVAIESGLAACANVLAPCTSVYQWEGTVQRETEHPVIFKTSLAQREALAAHLRAGHAYDLPAVSSWEVETDQPFAAWVADSAKA